MNTIPEAAATVNFDAALRTLTAQSTTRYPGEQARIDRGLVIALNGGVTLCPDGTTRVQSQRDAEMIYEIRNGRCDCPDAERAPEARCKHQWSLCFTYRAISLLAANVATPRRTTCEPAPVRWYATYIRHDGETVHGIATHTPHGYLFAAEDGSEYCYASTGSLVLEGQVALAKQQRALDGALAAKVCGYWKRA